MLTWTDQPQQAVWDHLRVLSHEANVVRLLRGEMKSGRPFCYLDHKVIARKSRQIARAIEQAHEFYRAAQDVTLATSPLIYFYGMLSLAKALIVANAPDKFLENIQYHGLASRPTSAALKAYHEDPATWSIENEFAVVRGGVFVEFMQVVLGRTLPEHAIIRFKSLMQNDPELDGMFEKIYGHPSSCCYFSGASEDGKQFTVPVKGRTALVEKFPKILDAFNITTAEEAAQVRLALKPDLDLAKRWGVYKIVSGARYFVYGLTHLDGADESSLYLPPEIQDYVAMFILSNAVRYKQEFWGDVLDGRKSGAIGLIQRLISISTRRYPNFILDQLFGERFEYGAAGRMI